MLDTIRENFEENLERVENLVTVYESHPDAHGEGRKSAQVLDILRAAVVFLHAALEEALRSVARWKLPSADSAILDEIPLVGQGSNPKKFLLGELADHRGKRIDDVLTESVNAYLEHSNYNNTADITKLLRSVGVVVDAAVNYRFADIQALMERRHQIVHRADRQPVVTGSGDPEIRVINRDTVRNWIAVVRDFGATLFARL
jgi:hypothetical protein